jgi:hypothetical protein
MAAACNARPVSAYLCNQQSDRHHRAEGEDLTHFSAGAKATVIWWTETYFHSSG